VDDDDEIGGKAGLTPEASYHFVVVVEDPASYFGVEAFDEVGSVVAPTNRLRDLLQQIQV
jgi:hypothetical protein